VDFYVGDHNSCNRTTLPGLWKVLLTLAAITPLAGRNWVLSQFRHGVWRRVFVQRMRQDVTERDREIDSALQGAVAGEVGEERYDLWFGDHVSLRLTSKSLEVSAADQFTLDRLQSQFRLELLSAGRMTAGKDVELHFRLDPRLGQSDRVAANAVHSNARRTSTSAPARAGQGNRRRRFATLEQFVVGQNNRLAHTAANMVVERPGSVTPLFLFGPTGSGKTHLLEGIWSAVRQGSESRRVLYLTAEQFTSMFLEALQGSGLPSFRYKYRHVDILLLDDVQFFLGKRATIVELQNTIDSLLREQRQLVLAADRSPAELSKFGPELTARFSGGLVCNMEGADVETRLRILEQLASRMEAHIPNDVLQLIAEHLDGDARKLAGALNQLEAASRAYGRAIDSALAQSTLADVFRATYRVVKLDDIDRAVCDVFGLEPQSLQSERKARTFSQPRALAMWLARKHTRAAYAEIGEYFGHRSHSTVISAQKQVHRWMDANQAIRLAHGNCEVQEAIRRVETQIRTG
jgi:chromosomal replication initiator protein